MKLLAFETSAKAASVALMDDGVILGEYYVNNGKTHSATLMPMTEQLLAGCDVRPADLDVVAAAIGPGSFTGIRIGIAAAKGLAFGIEKPCCAVSTLEAMAWQMRLTEGLVCPVMDARRSQVYNALFEISGGKVNRIRPDRAISMEELQADLLTLKKPVFLVGDGSKLCYNTLSVPDLVFPPAHMEMQHASGVAMAAEELVRTGHMVSADALLPNYLRLSQAERMRLERETGAQ